MINSITGILLLLGGAVLGWILGSVAMPLSRERRDRLHQNALHYLREGDQLRHKVIDFIKQARLVKSPTEKDWHDLVEAMLHEGTPKPIKQAYHRLCGTVLPADRDDAQVIS